MPETITRAASETVLLLADRVSANVKSREQILLQLCYCLMTAAACAGQ